MDEPTLAADLDKLETQSVHAWSQADDGEAITEYIPRRSWKIPAVVVVVAASAVITAGVFLIWPQSAVNPQATHLKPTVTVPVKPTIATSAPAQLQSPDQRYLALLKQRGAIIVSPVLAINAAHEICADLSQGYLAREIADAEYRATPGENLNTAATLVATAQEVYCPPSR